MPVYNDNALSIGKTPLVRLNRVVSGKATVLAKIEGRNPSYSVKCRIGANMIWDGEERGALKPGMEIVEPTSGNTGIALSYAAAAKGYKVRLVMPDTMSLERRMVMKAFGAELVLTDGAKGMKGAIDKALEIYEQNPDKVFMPQQFDNPANPAIHEKTTGPEIHADLPDGFDVLVCGVGTGGTITGLSRYFKQKLVSSLISVAVEPETSPVISQKLAGQDLKPGKHKIQGIGAGFLPGVLDLSLIDRAIQVSDDEAMDFSRRLAKEEGIFAGISSGAAVAACDKLSKLPEFEGKTIVTVLPDSGERYLTTPLFKDLV